MPDVRFDAAAIADVRLARDWYEREQAGLGEAFVDSVEATVGSIGLFPSAGSLVAPGLSRPCGQRRPLTGRDISRTSGLFSLPKDAAAL